MEQIGQEEFYQYLDLIEKYYYVTFNKEARNTAYEYCADIKHGGLGICIDILKIALDNVRPEWICISNHLAHSDETKDYFPDSYRMKTPENDLSCYDPNAVYISKEDMVKLKPVPITASLLRSACKYHIIV